MNRHDGITHWAIEVGPPRLEDAQQKRERQERAGEAPTETRRPRANTPRTQEPEHQTYPNHGTRIAYHGPGDITVVGEIDGKPSYGATSAVRI